MYKNRISFILMCIPLIISIIMINSDLFDIIKIADDIETQSDVKYLNYSFKFYEVTLIIISVLPIIFYLQKGHLIASRNLLILFIFLNIAYLFQIGYEYINYYEYIELSSSIDLVYIRFASIITALLFYDLKDYVYNTSFEVEL